MIELIATISGSIKRSIDKRCRRYPLSMFYGEVHMLWKSP